MTAEIPKWRIPEKPRHAKPDELVVPLPPRHNQDEWETRRFNAPVVRAAAPAPTPVPYSRPKSKMARLLAAVDEWLDRVSERLRKVVRRG